MKLPDKKWWIQTAQIYLFFGLLGGIISSLLLVVKTVRHGFEFYYIELILSMVFFFPLLVTAVFCIPELLFGKPNDRS